MSWVDRMNPASDKLAIEAPPAKLCYASLAIGLLLGGIALAAMRIDVLNNYDYGVQISHELAGQCQRNRRLSRWPQLRRFLACPPIRSAISKPRPRLSVSR